jgi:triacylglycerol lipase
VAAILSQWNWQLLDLFDQPVPGGWPRTGAKGFVARAGDTRVVSIAGTEPNSIGTWFQNFDFPADGDGAHRGFQAGARIVLSAVSDILAARNEPIFLTGHSLGGTVAAMTAMLMGESLLNRTLGIYTIGMPRSGNARYRDPYHPRLGARTFRLVHGDDLVPKVPPRSLKFRHVGALLACERRGRFEGQPAIPPNEATSLEELRQIALSPFGSNQAPDLPARERAAVLAAARLSEPIRDHLSDCYLRALGALT